ncbi:MAG: hypothetical protein IPK32_00345 [Verrucomicrobiaceae bacterium]|nr:hypothetical protein [Verrucomicrobiaceae bacterium]
MQTLTFRNFRIQDEGILFDAQFPRANLAALGPFKSIEELNGSQFMQMLAAFAEISTINIMLPQEADVSSRVEQLQWEKATASQSRLIPLMVTNEERGAANCAIQHPPKTLILASKNQAKPDQTTWSALQPFSDDEIKKVFGESANIGSTAQSQLSKAVDADVLVLIAHGIPPSPGRYIEGAILLDEESEGVKALSPSDLAAKLRLLGPDCCPPVLLLVCCALAMSCEAIQATSFAGQLMKLVPELVIVTAYTELVARNYALEAAKMALQRFAQMKVGQELGHVFALENQQVKGTSLRVFLRSDKVNFSRRHVQMIAVQDAEIIQRLKLAMQSNSPPVLVVGSGMMPELETRLKEVAEGIEFKMKGWPRRDPAELSAGIYHKNQDNAYINRMAKKLLLADPPPSVQNLLLVRQLAALKPTVIFNLNRNITLYKELKKAGRKVKVLFTSPRVPVAEYRHNDFNELLKSAVRDQTTILIQPFGIIPIAEVDVNDFFDEKDKRSHWPKTRRNSAARIGEVYSTQIDMLEWLCTSGENQPAAGSLPDVLEEMITHSDHKGVAFLGVAPDMLETQVFLTWFADQLSSPPSSVYVNACLSGLDQDHLCEDQYKVTAYLVDLVRYFLRIETANFFQISSSCEGLMAELTRE